MEEYNFEKFNVEKSIHAILYIAQQLRRKDFHKIFKVLYFADRDHISDFGRSISGDTYIAMEDGPVPSNIYDILKSVRGDGFFKDDGRFSKLFQIENWDLVYPIIAPDLNKLSKTDIQYIDSSLNAVGDLSWEEVREKSHDYAWKRTVPNTPISIESMIMEAGNEASYVAYINEQIQILKSF